MSNEEFKKIADKYLNNPMQLCWEVYLEEQKVNRIDKETFDHVFNIFIMMNGGMGAIVNRLKQKYNYGI